MKMINCTAHPLYRLILSAWQFSEYSVDIKKILMPVIFFSDNWPRCKPLIIYGLLAHEQKMSLLNMVLKRHPSCTVPIPNKQRLIFHVGYRHFEAEPVFSQHTSGDKFKVTP